MASEPDASGMGQFTGTVTSRGMWGRTRSSNINAQFAFDIPGIGQVQQQLTGVTDALKELKATLSSMSSGFTSGPIVTMLSEIRKEAAKTSDSLRDLSGAVSGVSGGGGRRGGGGGGGGPIGGNSTSSNAGIALSASSSAGLAIAAAGGGGTGSTGGATTDALGKSIGGLANTFSGGSLVSKIPFVGAAVGMVADLAMLPMRFARERIQNNRVQALGMSQELTPYQWATGSNTTSMMGSLGNGGFPGGIQGDVSDILTALTVGRRSGAMYGFGGGIYGQKRAGGFYTGISQMQQITPGIGAGQLSQVLGNQVSNTASQQASAFYTGGAFSMIKMGGGQKSIAEWADGILSFLQSQRPGADRGKPFKYADLLAQNFPGSNINAWFQTVGVTPDMMDYFWSYALKRAAQGSDADVFKNMGGDNGALEGNQAWRRLASQNALTRNEFGLAGRMGGQYATRERSNKWFNQAMGALVNRLVPALSKALGGGATAYLPDQVEDFVWNALESSGPLIQTLVGGVADLATGATLGADLITNPPSLGDIGDVGDYGMTGGRTTAGLSLDMRPKINRMMRANPNLRINSGLRDTYTQSKLKAKGIGSFGSRNGKSPHYSGQAADLGPSSQYGWLQANAHKFGLQTAGHLGEPWHVQRAGTIGIGEPDENKPGWQVPGTQWTVPGTGWVGEKVEGVSDTYTGILKLIELFKKAFSTAINAAEMAQKAAGVLDLGSIFGGGGANLVANTSEKFLSLLTGGMNAKGGLQGFVKNGQDLTLPYDPSAVGGLPTSLNLTNYSTSSGGGFAGSLADWPKAGETARAVDPGTAGRIRMALDVASQAGFSGNELITFVALAGRESNFNATAYNGNLGTGDNSYGLWQINTLGGMWEQMSAALGLTSKDQLLDPLTNAKAGRYLFEQSSTPFHAWGPYKGESPLHGGGEQWVAPVYQIAKQDGYIGDPGYGDTRSGGHTFIFNNDWKIEAGGSGGGLGGNVDVGRLVPLMADKLEAEMKRRLVSTR